MRNKLALGCWSVGVLLMMGVACSGDDDDDLGPPHGGSAGEAGEAGAGAGTAGKGTQGGSGGESGHGGSGGDSGHGGTSFEHSCSKPVTNPETGLVTCEEGYRHRPKAVACGEPAGSGGEGGGGGEGAGRLPRAGQGVVCDVGQGGNGGGGATTTGDCDAYEHGFCEVYDDGAGGAFGLCRSGCVDDAECGPGFVCICDEPDSPTGGACKPASCATDADCGSGFFCATYDNSCNPEGFACQVAEDECQANADCAEGTCNFTAAEARHFCDADVCAN